MYIIVRLILVNEIKILNDDEKYIFQLIAA